MLLSSAPAAAGCRHRPPCISRSKGTGDPRGGCATFVAWPLDEHRPRPLEERQRPAPLASGTQDLVGQVPLDLVHDVAGRPTRSPQPAWCEEEQHFDEVPHGFLPTVLLATGRHRSGRQGPKPRADPVGRILRADLQRGPLPRDELQVRVHVDHAEQLPWRHTQSTVRRRASTRTTTQFLPTRPSTSAAFPRSMTPRTRPLPSGAKSTKLPPHTAPAARRWRPTRTAVTDHGLAAFLP